MAPSAARSPIRFGDPLDVAVDRHQRLVEAEQQQRPTPSSCRCPGSPSASRGPRAAASSPRNSSEWSPRSSRIRAERRLDPRRLLGGEAARPDDVDQLRRAARSRPRPSPAARRGGRPSPPQPAPGSWISSAQAGRIGRPERHERLLGVDVGAVLGEDREDQLGRRVEPAAPDLRAVEVAERVERVLEQARADSGRAASPRRSRDRAWRASAASACGFGFARLRRRAAGGRAAR